jgi:hypothetical protein
MHRAIGRTGSGLAFIAAWMLVGCAGAWGGGDYKSVQAYDKVKGEYFEVRVPNESHLGTHGRWSRDEPSRSAVEHAVDKATWEHESSSSIDHYLAGARSGGGTGGSAPTTASPSPFDHSTLQGSSYHEATGPFGR